MPNAVQNTFNRWEPSSSATMAYRLFRRDLVELNTFAWTSQGAVHHAAKLMSKASDKDEVRSVLDYGPDPGRRGDTLAVHARQHFKDIDNWLRLATLVFAASSLELFVRRVVALSLRSDPGMLIGSSRAVDGITALKEGRELDIRSHVKSTTEGVWSSREVGLSKIFGGRVDVVYDNVKDLHAIQTLRNSVAHDFARTGKKGDFWYVDPELALPEAVSRLSASRLQTLLRLISLVAEQIEKWAAPHIGIFELILFWHSFLEERNKPRTTVVKRYVELYKEGGVEKLLSTYSHAMVGRPIGREYSADLLRHYDAC